VIPVYGTAPVELWELVARAVEGEWRASGLEQLDVLTFRTGQREADCELAAVLARRLGLVASLEVTAFDDDVVELVDALGRSRVALCGRFN
jgi:hypothetical protein